MVVTLGIQNSIRLSKHVCLEILVKFWRLFNDGGKPENFSFKKEKNRRQSNCHSNKIVDTVQNMIDDIDDLGTSIRQIGRLLGNMISWGGRLWRRRSGTNRISTEGWQFISKLEITILLNNFAEWRILLSKRFNWTIAQL